MSVDNMYADIILDYYRNPRNYGTITDAEIKASDSNPLCGDEIEINIKLNGNSVKDVKFSGKGCAISQAAAGMLTEMVAGKNLEEAAKLTKKDILDVLSIPISHVRIKCALLSLKVLKLGIYSHIGGKLEDELKNL
ncbi:MAG: SUF system NifU family Fe-S cluster assembly protein [Candidatus Aenigmarchaeota archaeon]|nr:SUF system NifU family Fe-S cluster assembly protein [Candidatus Aenigmarchaeota archaeon]